MKSRSFKIIYWLNITLKVCNLNSYVIEIHDYSYITGACKLLKKIHQLLSSIIIIIINKVLKKNISKQDLVQQCLY